jgi:Ca2+-binding EF-hand superfamily protein
MLQQLGIKVQKFELHKILEQHDRNKDGHLTKEEFENVRKNIKKLNLLIFF